MNLKENTELQNGKYRIIRVLGQGGFGITYLAENVFFNKIVAIKEFFPKSFCGRDNTSHLTLGTSNNAETVEKLLNRFMKEAKNIAKLDHPGIVKIQDIFKENNTAYYVMDYIEGENLNEIVKRNGPLSEEKAVEYIKKVGEALSYIHSKNMTHFDVKPANIMIRRSDDTPILIDFGLSKQYDNSGDATSTMLNAVSQGYSPIELYNPGSLTEFSPQTDVYSLAATLLFLLTGKTPPSASDIATDGLSLPDYIPNKMKESIEVAMNYKRRERPNDIGLLVDNLYKLHLSKSNNGFPKPDPDEDEETKIIGGNSTPPTPDPLPRDNDSSFNWTVVFLIGLIVLIPVSIVLCSRESERSYTQPNNNASIGDSIVMEEVDSAAAPAYEYYEYYEAGVPRGTYSGKGYWSGNSFVPHGEGTVEYYSGDKDKRNKYIGQFINGERSNGTLYYKNGAYYTGSLRNNDFWDGSIHWNNGNITYIRNGVEQ